MTKTNELSKKITDLLISKNTKIFVALKHMDDVRHKLLIVTKKDKYFGDAARTFAVGRISDEKRRLLQVTEEALYEGIRQARAGNHLHDISAAVQRHVEEAGFSVVRDLVGHGIGKNLHEEPAVPNYGTPGTGILLKEHMTLAIEPMVNAGTYVVRMDDDGWTVRTADGKPSAHFEHTVVLTNDEAEILTRHG